MILWIVCASALYIFCKNKVDVLYLAVSHVHLHFIKQVVYLENTPVSKPTNYKLPTSGTLISTQQMVSLCLERSWFVHKKYTVHKSHIFPPPFQFNWWLEALISMQHIVNLYPERTGVAQKKYNLHKSHIFPPPFLFNRCVEASGSFVVLDCKCINQCSQISI